MHVHSRILGIELAGSVGLEGGCIGLGRESKWTRKTLRPPGVPGTISHASPCKHPYIPAKA